MHIEHELGHMKQHFAGGFLRKVSLQDGAGQGPHTEMNIGLQEACSSVDPNHCPTTTTGRSSFTSQEQFWKCA